MNKHAELLIEAALAGHIKKADLDPMILFGLLGGAAGAGTSAVKTMTGDQPTEGAGLRALRAGLMGAGLGAAGAGGLKMMGVNPTLPKLVEAKKEKGSPASASVGVGLLGAGAVGGAGALDRARARNRTMSANADVLQAGRALDLTDPANEAAAKELADLKKQLGGAPEQMLPAEGGVRKALDPKLMDRLKGFNRHGLNLNAALAQQLAEANQQGQAAKALKLEKLIKALRTKGNQARPGWTGRMGGKGILAAGAGAGLLHYMLNRDSK